MKILLVNPPNESQAFSMPMGLASIAAYLKNKDKDIDISVIDDWAEKLESAELARRVSLSRADIVGIYMVSPRYDQAKSTIEVCRNALPNSIIIAGGPHPSALPVETLREIPQLDICAIGEGELTMQELAEGKPLKTINGIAFRDGKEIKLTPPRDFIKNLDDLPFPNRDLFPLQKYKPSAPHGRKMPFFIMNTSRGCPFNCTYCSKDVFRNIYRTVSPKRVADEIEELISKYHAKEIFFSDDDFSMNIARAEGICDEILKRGVKIRWSTSTRVDQVTEQLLNKMHKAGCRFICYGVESGNQKVLDAIGKGYNTEKAVSAFKMTRRAKIATVCNFIIGLPGETKESIRDTLNLMKRIKPNFISGSILSIFPGSRLFKLIQAGEYPGKLRNLESSGRIFLGKGNYTVLEDNLTYEELKDELQMVKRKFLLRPQYFWQTLTDIRSLDDLKYYLQAGMEVIQSLLDKKL
ncbi:MAG: radical SAM protein [bacterium]|nr:radical SAM protein [bacterium]